MKKLMILLAGIFVLACGENPSMRTSETSTSIICYSGGKEILNLEKVDHFGIYSDGTHFEFQGQQYQASVGTTCISHYSK